MKNSMSKMITLLVLAMFAFTSNAGAHCDTMDGPVIKDAKVAIEKADVNLVLKWVKKEHENEVRQAFQKTLEVRKAGEAAKDLADRYFFETVVRLHRAGEGEPYTGIKPAGTEVESGIEMADKAIEQGSTDELIRHLSTALRENVAAHFNEVKESKNLNKNDVAAGREFVRAYVKFIHYVEGIHQAMAGAAVHHGEEQ